MRYLPWLARGSAIAALTAVAISVGLVGCAGDGSGSNTGSGGRSGGTGNGPGPGSGGSGSGNAGGGGPGAGGTIVIPPGPTALPPESACTSGSSGPRLLRRLSVDELVSTVADLFGDTAAPLATVFNDQPALGFRVDNDNLLVRDLVGQQLLDNAEAIAHWAVTTHLAGLSTCNTMDAACRRQFITAFGKRAFRAPLGDARVADYDQLFAAEASFSDGVEAVLTAMLQSPYFLYRREIGDPAAAAPAGGADVALTPYEVANNLSYLLIGSMPDPQLMAAADAGQLSTTAQIDAQVTRLLADPRSNDAIMRFASGWLEIDKLNTTVKDDTNTFPRLDDALKQDMMAETRGLILEAFQAGGSLSDLLTADHSFLTQPLANNVYNIYNVTGLGSTPIRVPYPANGPRDRGILAHASILIGHATANASSPTQRGHLVRTRLMCLEVPPMPANKDTALKPPVPGETTRQHYETHGTNPDCVGCHHLMDPIGFGFEHYDGFAHYRTQDQNMAVDSSGTLTAVAGGDVTFDGLNQLSTILAGRDETKSCLVRYWSYYAYGAASWPQDACTYAAIRDEAAAQGYSLRSVLTAIVHAPHFTRRQPDL